MTANRHRGEVRAVLDGVPRTLKLTLGALAELEADAGEDLGALLARLDAGRMSARDAVRLIAAGLRGAGRAAEAAAAADIAIEGGPLGGFRLAAELVAAAFGAEDVPAGNPPGNRSAPPGAPPTERFPGGA